MAAVCPACRAPCCATPSAVGAVLCVLHHLQELQFYALRVVLAAVCAVCETYFIR